MPDEAKRIDLIRWKAEQVRALPPGSAARQAGAAETLVSALRLARELCGDDVLADAYAATAETADRATVLRDLAARLHLLGFVFVGVENGPGQIDSLINELKAVAGGDAPALLAQIGSRRIRHRVMMSKFDASRWEAYLTGLGIETVERHNAIADSFSMGAGSWDTIGRWKHDAAELWGERAVERRLRLDYLDGKNGLRRWTMRPGETWRAALDRAGKRHDTIMREHNSRSRTDGMASFRPWTASRAGR